MSEGNLQMVRTMLDTWNRPGDEWLTFFDPAVEFSDVQAAIGMRDRGHGIDDLREAAAQWSEIFSDWRVVVGELTGFGQEWVLAELWFKGLGRDSGVSVSLRQFDAFRLRGDKVVEYRAGYRDRREAEIAVGELRG